MNKINIIRVILFIQIMTFLLAGCGAPVSVRDVTTALPTPSMTPTPTKGFSYVTATIDPSMPTVTPTKTTGPTLTMLPSRTPTPITPTATLNPTQQTWLSTAVSIQGTENAVSEQNRNVEATKIAEFPVACDNIGVQSISADGHWLATSCGYKRDQTLVVQNKAGTKWILQFKDFLHPDSFFDGQPPMGALYPKFWSPDGKYLYFVSELGYSGGGNQCFPGFGNYGLFRLNLENGTWVTLITPTNSFPGYEIDFSPTGRRYATDIYGITITDLYTGEVIRIDAPGIMEMLWSPDGTYLAYSVADCGEQWVETSSVYLWNALTNQIQLLFSTDNILLRPEAWSDNSTLRVAGEQYVDSDWIYSIFIYDISQMNLIFTGTATPSP